MYMMSNNETILKGHTGCDYLRLQIEYHHQHITQTLTSTLLYTAEAKEEYSILGSACVFICNTLDTWDKKSKVQQ